MRNLVIEGVTGVVTVIAGGGAELIAVATACATAVAISVGKGTAGAGAAAGAVAAGVQYPNLPIIGYTKSILMRDSQGRDSFTEDTLLSVWD